ncbi:MAG TPA: ABC transporter permease/substrate-binding protein [Vicinamibacterales bacterium]|nr:ABC transporter permease/substrate-binding protein [Vicinamibacterales bacterium]
MTLLRFWQAHASELWAMIERHVVLVVLSSGAAIALGVPIGILAAHRPRIGKPLVAFANVAQTVPSLALLGFLLPLPFIGGIGSRVAILALILYALLPIVRGTIAGITTVDAGVVTAATAMGMTNRQLLWLVELPLALPSILAGIRVATVVGVGTATIAAAIGAGGLGEYIFRGLSMVDSTVILAGAVPAALLAVAADLLLTWVERTLRPSRHRASRRRVLVTASALTVIAVAFGGLSMRSAPDAIVVGSKNFTEQIILGELFAQSLEARGIVVTRRLNLGGTFICDRALRSGDIDVYPEYTGTALTAVFHETVGHDRGSVLERTRRRYAEGGVTVLEPLGFDNTFAILVRRADAESLGLRSIGDLKQVQQRWQPGFGFEFVERQDGYRGLAAAYGLSFARDPRVMDLALMYRALASGEVDVVAGDATSAMIAALDLAVLADDRGYFPPYDAVAVARTATLLRRPEVRQALEALGGQVSAAEMRTMNRAVDVDHRDAAEVVRQFLKSR